MLLGVCSGEEMGTLYGFFPSHLPLPHSKGALFIVGHMLGDGFSFTETSESR